MIYLDYAAATPVDRRVLAAMTSYFSDEFYNPSAAYLPARAVREAYEDAKHRIAQTIGAKPAEIVMTSGATESINLAIFGVIASSSSSVIASSSPHVIASAAKQSSNNLSGLPRRFTPRNDGTMITTAVEHPAVLECARAVGATILPVDAQGRMNLDDLRAKITDATRLVSVGYANNELGTVQNIKQIAAICASERAGRAERGVHTPLVFHTDASQAAGLLDVNVARLGVDMMTLNSGKCYGPKGVGTLYARSGTELGAIVKGGGQEMGLRSGTENVSGVIGFAKALEIAEKMRKSEVKRLEILRKSLEKHITTHFSFYKDSPCKINSGGKHCLPNILNFSLAGLDGERLVYALDQRGVMVATGSACAASKGAPSHVLNAIGLSPAEADGSLRVSMGRGTTQEQIDEFVKILDEVVAREREINA